MAIDCVPQASQELKDLLHFKERLEEVERIYRDKSSHLSFLKEELPNELETEAVARYVGHLEAIRERRAKEWAEAEKKLCPRCKGAQWDPSARGQMAHSCGNCGGTGLLSGVEARDARMREELASMVERGNKRRATDS